MERPILYRVTARGDKMRNPYTWFMRAKRDTAMRILFAAASDGVPADYHMQFTSLEIILVCDLDEVR